MKLQYKALPVSGFKVLDQDEGIIEAIVSVTGLVDRVKDNIKPGAYEKSLAVRKPKGVWGHDWNTPVSKTLEATELPPGHKSLPKKLANGEAWPKDAGGLKVKTQFNLDTQAGREAYSNVLFFGEDQEWSIGYQVPQGAAKTDSKSGIRAIDTLDLYEYSPVLFGAMPFARSISEKAFEEAEDKDKFFTEPQMAFKALKDALGEEKALTFFEKSEHDHVTADEDGSQDGDTSSADEDDADVILEMESEDVIEVEQATTVEDPDGETKMYPNIDGSMESLQDNLRNAVREKFNPKPSISGEYTGYAYLASTFSDYVIVCIEGKGKTQHYRVDYTTDADGNVTLADTGKPVKIRVQSTVEEKVGRVLSGKNSTLITTAVDTLKASTDALTALLESATSKAKAEDDQQEDEGTLVAAKSLQNIMEEKADTLTLDDDVRTSLVDIAKDFDTAVEADDLDAAEDAAEEFVDAVTPVIEESEDAPTVSALREIVGDMGETLADMADVEDDSSEDEEEDTDTSDEKVLIRLSGSDDQQGQKDNSPSEKKSFDLSRRAAMRKSVLGR